MTRTLACLHAHHSNIPLVEAGFASHAVELVHYVDPGFDRRKSDPGFSSAAIRHQVADRLGWIAGSGADGVLVTCTLFAAYLPPEADSSTETPVITIDAPFFAELCGERTPLTLVFTNPATVQGTMERLAAEAEARGLPAPAAEAVLLPDTFPLLMQGRADAYRAAVRDGLERLLRSQPDRSVCAAQLSMAPAAELVNAAAGEPVVRQPLAAVVRETADRLGLAALR
ncbi:hypothetical protein J31TS4_32950 [Paenibacillus sp. J31TS4]|uniref:hypothetical protein n=1 Tax=Paenibacillus sp. J31TS4 TaxID=2807195 RepID=UPI001B10CE50|nr:hypothetical protein [Paenibacillus sp. J31TS4]GIP40015.1 hypothetical protein J31TS4_32950 [Paenibacillus sp. J31TS4]